jgi:phosphate butyryltransferase
LAGTIVGARVPIVLTSRADDAETRLYSIALSALLAKAG